MDLSEGREPLGVVAAEVGVEPLLGVDTQELAHDLHGQHFRVGELGVGTALAQLLLVCHEPVVDHAEDGDDEGVKIHERTETSFCFSFCFSWSVKAPPSVEEVSVFLQSLKRNLHTGLASRRISLLGRTRSQWALALLDPQPRCCNHKKVALC